MINKEEVIKKIIVLESKLIKWDKKLRFIEEQERDNLECEEKKI